MRFNADMLFFVMALVCLLLLCTAIVGHAAVQNRVTPGLLSCETYSVRELFGQGKLTLETVPELYARLNIPGVTFNDMFFTSWDQAYLDKLNDAMAKAKRVPCCLIMEGNLANPDDERWEQQIKDNTMKLKAAAYLGCPVVRMNVGGTGDAQRDATYGVERVAAAFNRMLPLAKELNIKITIENHGGVSATADNILRIIQLTDRNWVGSCLDFGNWPDEVRYESCRKLAPYVYHVHAKAHHFDAVGEAEYEWGRMLADLRAAGYNRALSIEWEGGGDPIEGVIKSRDLILRYWPAGANTLSEVWRMILPKGAKAQKIKGGFQFTEGPAWDGKGGLYFSDIPADTIYHLGADGKVSTFLKPSGQANGLMVDKDGNVIACRHQARDVVRIGPDKKITVLASSFEGKRLNSPNDLAISASGAIYFTDPAYGLEGRPGEQPVEGVYRIGADGTVTRVVDDMARPNGIVLGPGEKTLYVADSERKVVRAYDLSEDGKASNGRDFATVKGTPDGMGLDAMGDLYVTADGIWLFDYAGNKLGVIPIPEVPANLDFDGADLKTLYVTAQKSVYKVNLGIAGWRNP
jgi:sugar lactone lactonase YvrE/sugar phosphate isomerase/epimerase